MFSWTRYTEYSHLSSALWEADAKEFERKALPVLRVMWPDAIRSASNRGLDRAGIDIYIRGEDGSFPLVVQCKGFRVGEEEIESGQIDLCLESIRSFRESEFYADRYILLHNRDGKKERFRLRVGQALEELKKEGRVSEVSLWDRHTLLREAFDKMYERLKEYLADDRLVREFRGFAGYEPLDKVPFRQKMLTVNQYGLLNEGPFERCMDSLVDRLVSAVPRVRVLLGMAGYGKTTAASLVIERACRPVFYVPAASISKKVVGIRDLLMDIVKLEELIRDAGDEERSVHEKIARAAIGRLFTIEGVKAIIVLDGIDESVFFTREDGIQWLMNVFRDVKVPVVLTMRTEMWNERYQDLATMMGNPSSTNKRQNRKVTIPLMELVEWEDDDILELCRRFQETCGTEERERVQGFTDLVENGRYHAIYGDIPRRPLFLNWILESVSEHGVGVSRVKRAELFKQYAYQKIKRDIWGVLGKGGPGRVDLVPSSGTLSLEDLVDLSLRLMVQAAGLMTEVVEGELEILSECDFQELKMLRGDFREVSSLGLNLTSLLISPPRKKGKEIKLGFAHRVFQEVFLAYFINDHPDRFEGIQLPADVDKWCDDVRELPLLD